MSTNAMEKCSEAHAVEQSRPARTVYPPVDLFETKEAYVIVTDVPGVSEGGLDVRLEKDTIRIEGRLESGIPESAGGQKHGKVTFERSFHIGKGVDRDKISAELKSGVLRVVLAKAAEARPRQITVQTLN